ncbi:MAG: DUF2804 family protein [Actinobacteria bacterium]|nr:DUF2804 family protein [Actinomycetota bacterium]
MPPVRRFSAPLAPYRGRFGDARPTALSGLPLPPARMPSRRGTRPLKRWRYVGVYGPELMLCVGHARVGPGQQWFWAVWDRPAGRLHERTRLRRGGMRLVLDPGRVLVEDGPVLIELTLEEGDGVETVCPAGDGPGAGYTWTRKQGGVRAHGTVVVDGAARALDALAVVDDSAGYHARRTAWQWCAGVGRALDGRPVAWNLVAGLNDPPRDSERTVWVDGEPAEVGPAARFAADLSAVATDDGADLRFAAEAVRERRENLLLVRSEYRQPFGTFTGALPGPDGAPLLLAEGWGVMEQHSALW